MAMVILFIVLTLAVFVPMALLPLWSGATPRSRAIVLTLEPGPRGTDDTERDAGDHHAPAA
jgi:hypothetical protein